MDSTGFGSLVSPAGAGASDGRRGFAAGGLNNPQTSQPPAPVGPLGQAAQANAPAPAQPGYGMVRPFTKADIPWLLDLVKHQQGDQVSLEHLQTSIEQMLSNPQVFVGLRTQNAAMGGINKPPLFTVPMFNAANNVPPAEIGALLHAMILVARHLQASAMVFPIQSGAIGALAPALLKVGAVKTPEGTLALKLK